MNNKVIYILVFISQIIASNFLLKDQSDTNAIVNFNIGEYSFETIDDHKYIISNAIGKTVDYGEPELPIFSFNYSIKNDKDYHIDYNVLEYDSYQNINIL